MTRKEALQVLRIVLEINGGYGLDVADAIQELAWLFPAHEEMVWGLWLNGDRRIRDSIKNNIAEFIREEM